ncbi:iron complex transport system permease protein [Pseudochelatococcus lubricantis]|uniref:Iron complex transport system permease protein n=1 Tax=Pseudochelatococcus lubricantis TaxID=1538102 RepID=A0ABX0V687_9HYPH|nr:iron ABC transporter permease [Pseudochelatococcus lubricantis]NIJ59835.1 iron complex transport system permease protein [Pseudochelatococcus lubricantis]
MTVRAGGIAEAPLSHRRRKRLRVLAGGLLLLGLAAFCSLIVGSRPIPLGATFDALVAYDIHDDRHLVIRELRVPRTIVALLAGAALGAAGAIMQAATRNPLAEPGLLGINAGAAVAVVIGIAAFDLTSMTQYVWFGIAGAGFAGIAVFVLGRAHETGTNPVRLVLAGAGLSIMLTAITGIVIINAPLAVFDDFRKWSAGSIEGRGFDVVGVLAVAVPAGLATAFAISGRLNAVALGMDLGRALGVNVRTTWFLACVSIMLLTGAATAGAGPIGFVGLVAPHLARMTTGPDFRWILPCSALFAAVLLLGADILGRVIAAPSEVAAGIIAALIGGPFLIAVVRRSRLTKL